MTKNNSDPLSIDDRVRSNFVRQLVQGNTKQLQVQQSHRDNIAPKHIVQFWDDLDRLPHDVKQCMESWKKLEEEGFEIKVFDENAAKQFIRTHLGARFESAFEKCYHPSMKSDYFRYAYIFVKGGFYIDADDVYHGEDIDHLFTDGRLKLQPFCYDIETAQMLSPSIFLKPGENSLNWVFYFNTTPLIAGRNHPIVEHVLLKSTIALEQESKGKLPEVQATTGPGILTESVVELILDNHYPEKEFFVIHNWEQISTSKWPLSYRNDKRNWRLSNRQEYVPERN